MNETYFVIAVNNDGDVSTSIMDKDTLLKQITPDEYGETYYGKVTFLTARQFAESSPQYWGQYSNGSDAVLAIIKGAVIEPTPVKIVTAYRV